MKKIHRRQMSKRSIYTPKFSMSSYVVYAMYPHPTVITSNSGQSLYYDVLMYLCVTGSTASAATVKQRQGYEVHIMNLITSMTSVHL